MYTALGFKLLKGQIMKHSMNQSKQHNYCEPSSYTSSADLRLSNSFAIIFGDEVFIITWI